MSSYAGTPQRSNSISLADDGSPPQAGSINPGIVANRDHILWIEQAMAQGFAKFSAKNFVPSDMSAAVAGGGGSSAQITALAANPEHFVAAVRSGLDLDQVHIVLTRDGFGWSSRRVLSMPAAASREVGALAMRADGWIVAALSGKNASSGNQGAELWVINPTNVLNNATRGVSTATNYKAAAFVGDRCYAIGTATGIDSSGGAIPGGTTRVVTASEAGLFVDWTTPVGGGGFIGGPGGAGNWHAAALGSKCIFHQGLNASDAGYVLCDATTNTVAQFTFPGSGFYLCPVVAWNGRFWSFETIGANGPTVNVYASTDGVSWGLTSTISIPGGAGGITLAEAGALVLFSAVPGGSVAGARTAYASFDGITFDALPVSYGGGAQVFASTAQRSAILLSRTALYEQNRTNLRISLGGLQ